MKLEDLSYDEQQVLADRLLTKKYGTMADVHAELRELYKVSSDTLYKWTKQLRADKHIHFNSNSIIKSKSTLTDEEGNIKLQWVKEDRGATQTLEAFQDAVSCIISEIKAINPIPKPIVTENTQLCNIYISNDLHIGALMEVSETNDREWDREIATNTVKSSIDFLIKNSPTTPVGVVIDLGDTTENDNYSNMTPKSGHKLDVDGRYHTILTVAMQSIVYMIEKALEKHELVYFYNIGGNHDMATSHAIRMFVLAWFKDNHRVIVNDSPSAIKYFLHGKTLIGMAHGDGLKMKDAGEVMAADNVSTFSNTENRYFHFGHNHKDSVYDGKICKCESHRNLAPLNSWAAHMGFRRQAGTMKCITYHTSYGEVARTTFNVGMINE